MIETGLGRARKGSGMHKNHTMEFVHCIASVISCESIIRLHVKRGTFYRVLGTVRKCH